MLKNKLQTKTLAQQTTNKLKFKTIQQIENESKLSITHFIVI